MITVSDMIRVAKHATGKQALSHGISWIDVVNEAGENFVNLHPWKYLENFTAIIPTVANQPWIDLPTNFMNFVVDPYYNSLSQGIEIVSQDVFLLFRSQTVSLTNRYLGMISWLPGPDTRPVLEIHPTPLSDDSDAIFIKYKGGWATLVNDLDIIAIPNYANPLFREVVRCVALGTEEQENGTVAARCSALKSTQFFRDVAGRDGRIQGQAGYIHGGAAERQRIAGAWMFDEGQEATRL